MKNIKSFEKFNESVVKKAGQHFPISELKLGDKVSYYGTIYTVSEEGDHVVELTPVEDGKKISINQGMFDDNGMISDI